MTEEMIGKNISETTLKILEVMRLEALELFPDDPQDEERFHFFIDIWQLAFLRMIDKFVHEEYRLKVSDNILKILKKNIKSHNTEGSKE